MIKSKKMQYRLCLVCAVLAALAGWLLIANTPIPILNLICGFAIGALVYLVLLTVVDGPLGPLVIRQNLERIGLTNRKGEAPMLLQKRPVSNFENGLRLTFENRGISADKWEDKRLELEATLNIFISYIKPGKTRRLVEIYAVPASCGLPTKIDWASCYLSSDDFTLVLGRGLTGLVTVDLSKIPHILIGGSTGSGKSVLLKCLLMQAIKKDAAVYIADFKGGVDFGFVWSEACHMIYDERVLREELRILVNELETRKKVLARAECRNIYEYNCRCERGPVYKRVIFACDEIAELLDKTGRTKEDKEHIDTIINYLSTIARQGRAMGIHLLLATQRPDANILPGQIKNNMDCRVCGRADNVLSQIILDNGDANDRIPKDAQGRFLMGDGTEFQGFWFDDSRYI